MTRLKALIQLLAVYLLIATPETQRAHSMRAFRKNDAANIASVGLIALTVIGVILAAVVGLRVLSALFPTYTSSVGSIAENFTTADWGDNTANDLSPIFGMVAALLGLIGAVSLVVIVLVVKYKKSHA